MNGIPDIEYLISNRAAFDAFVYSQPLEVEAELKKRWGEETLKDHVQIILKGNIPEPLTEGFGAVLVRHLITPNYETRRFIHITDALESLKPLLAEYSEDKFVPSNKMKKMLGKIGFHKGKDRNGNSIIERISLIDFASANGKKISEIKTLWDQDLAAFHREFFEQYVHSINVKIYDISEWYHSHVKTAIIYYEKLLALFLRHAVLFENLMLEDDEEREFIRNIFLPAFIELYRQTGYKPLIVALEPTEIEGEKFWLCYPPEDKEKMQHKLTSIKGDSPIK